MSGYIVEEPEEKSYYEGIDYWSLYSPLQRKRFKKVLYQMKETWYDVFNCINTFRNMGCMDLETSNILMSKIHKMFITEHKHKTEYYNEEKLKLRKQKGYLSKKIKKIKNTKQKI